jgi:hypothetical protein
MDFQEVLACLKYPEKCAQFIRKLKNAGENSEPFLQVQSAMVKLKMNKPPKGIDQTNILQHTFKFLTPKECFTKFRLVSKQWQNVAETIRFNQEIESYIFERFCSQPQISNGFGKYLKIFRKLRLPLSLPETEKGAQMKSIVLNRMKKLNHINFHRNPEPTMSDSFSLQMLTNSRETLQYLKLSNLIIPEMCLSKLHRLELNLYRHTSLLQFKNYFPQTLKKMKNIEKVRLGLFVQSDTKNISEYIAENYKKHCISAIEWDPIVVLDLFPVQILVGIIEIDQKVKNRKYAHEIRYLDIIVDPEYPFENGWENYREIFDQCTNLEAISLSDQYDENFIHESLPYLSEAIQEIWEKRISYFEARGIQIVDKDEIRKNKRLQKKLAKESGIRWRFHFF